ncbi:hypothetical protein FL857_12285 [Criibacterium bergeronii]|uniref:Group-specific protein n=1 Tax=Criibacterium bergeronii TaxID=1871336 RepID=A0A552US07_9FIRM|nr:hypothetical protein [Criibacterium bergeronii]TRW21019.1 hypothetical protein FL857_12285 [Criibacterium bergeronii]
MLIEPIYAENIIVGVIWNKIFKWYVTEKDLWFLDYNKLDKGYLEKGYDIEDIVDDNERRGIEVLDKNTVDIFLDRISKYLTTEYELNNLFNKISEFDDCLDFIPSILVDFDNKRFYSMFPELASFEDYIPEGWVGEYVDFTNLIQDEEKYWLNDLKENLFIKYKKIISR